MVENTPKVVIWYEHYCQAAIALFVVGSFSGLYGVVARESLAARFEVDPVAIALFSSLWLLTLLFLAFVHYAALKTPRVDWAWKIHAIVLGVGMTTLVLWPAALPLIWYWFKPETKAFYGMQVNA